MIYAPLEILPKILRFSELHEFLRINGNPDPGRYEIKGNDLFAVIMEYSHKSFDEAILESHEKYIDLQVVLRGEERVLVSDISSLKIISRDSEKDFISYQKSAKFAAEFVLTPSVFAVFFPCDAHCTQLSVNSSSGVVKKAVFKIACSLWQF